MHDLLVVGISTVDAIGRPIDRFPAPGGLRFFDELTLTTGGCAVNCAIALGKLGVECDCITRVGTDILGDFVLAELRRHGVGAEGVVRDAGANTPFTFVSVAAGGERSFLHTRGTNATICGADVPAAALRGRKAVFVAGAMLMDALDGVPTAELLRSAQAGGVKTMLDTVFVEGVSRVEWRRRIEPALPQLDYFVPSLPEARAICGLEAGGAGDCGDDVPHAAAAARQFQRDGARNVAIKLGAAGVFCREEGGRETAVPAVPVGRVVDATGAGDCWSAGFLAGLREGMPMAEAARLGNAVAACGIQAVGATAGVRAIADVRRMQ